MLVILMLSQCTSLLLFKCFLDVPNRIVYKRCVTSIVQSILSFISDGVYTHVDGSSPVWAKWKSGDPNGFVNGIVARCAVYKKFDVELEDNNCNEAQMFVCHKGSYDIASVQII